MKFFRFATTLSRRAVIGGSVVSAFFIIITLSVVLAIWTALVLRRPRGGLWADPIEGALTTWLQLRPAGEPDAAVPAAARKRAARPGPRRRAEA